MKTNKLTFLLLLSSIILAACAPVSNAPEEVVPSPTPMPQGAQVPAEDAEDNGDSPSESDTVSPPPGAQREFETDFSISSISFDDVLSGGPPKDGIPSIDQPNFISVEEADEWLSLVEPIIQVLINQEAKAYPIQILTWHEIVNDTVGGVPVVVTFCPLCNTGIAFDRAVDSQVLDFGTTGRLRFSNLIMYDRQTETWWQQATGEGIVGELTGTQLNFVPAAMISWEEFKNANPDGLVLSRDTGYNRDYGRNPYIGYDDVNNPPFLYRGPETPGELPPTARVLALELGDETIAYPYDVLSDLKVINDRVAGQEIVVFWAPGTSSALDASVIAEGEDVGAAVTYDRNVPGQLLSFSFDGENFIDNETGSTWDILGRALNGPLRGEQLSEIVSVNHFWFSWAAFKPDTRIYQP